MPSNWRARRVITRSFRTGRAKQRIRLSPTLRSRRQPDRSRRDRLRAPIVLRNTTNSCGSKNSLAQRHVFRGGQFFPDTFQDTAPIIMASATSLPESSSEYRVRLADTADTDALVRLINAAFVVEKPIIDGDRITAEKVSPLFKPGKFLLLKEGSQLLICISADLKVPPRVYLGLLAVDPNRQKKGLGRRTVE